MPSVSTTDGWRSQGMMLSICPLWASTIHSFGSEKTYSGESEGFGRFSKMRPEMTSAASPPSFRLRISSRCLLALLTTERMQMHARVPRSVPTNTCSSSGHANASAVMPTGPPSREFSAEAELKDAWLRQRVTLVKKLFIRSGRSDQKIKPPSLSAVTIRGASEKYLQHVTALRCFGSVASFPFASEPPTCFAKSMLYQKTSPSSETPVIMSLPSCAICRTGDPASFKSILLSTTDRFGSLSSWMKMTFSGEESDSTLLGITTICDTS
mmetsp:Transcript_76495/g.177513  ORF Transcript_76495/g.177513 Transcript_76495/m.177513 type:complete len:268 (-) Transcript_76495:1784-2587(-)